MMTVSSPSHSARIANVLTGSMDNTLATLGCSDRSVARREPLRHDDSVVAVAFSPDGERVLTRSYVQHRATLGWAERCAFKENRLHMKVQFAP